MKSEAEEVIGINYQLVEQPQVTSQKPSKESKAGVRKPANKPLNKEFRVTVRRSTTLTTELQVTASNERIARQKALETIRQQPFVGGQETDEIIALADRTQPVQTGG